MIHNLYNSENYVRDLIKQSIKNLKYDNNQSRYRFIDKLLDYYKPTYSSQLGIGSQ